MRLSAGAQNDLQVATLWEAFARMKFDAATIASEDLPDIDSLPPAAKAMLVCANVTYQNGVRNGKPVAPPALYKTVKTVDGRKVVVAIIGLLGDPPYLTIPNPANSPTDKPWKVSSPAEALAKVVPGARKKANIVVVMYAGTREPARKMLQEIPGIDVMVVGLEGSVDHQAEVVGKGVLVQNAERGRYGSKLGITLDKQLHPIAWDLRSVTMDAAFADDPAMMTLVREFHDKQTKLQAPVVLTPVAAKSEWAGSFTCSSCHTAQFDQWKSSKHFVAMATLEMKDNGQPAKRADCVRCHVVAFDKPGGFMMAQPRSDLRGVGCESCHGPAAAHVDARSHNTTDTSKLIANPSKDLCQACHTKDNSPHFDFPSYRVKIVHKTAVAAK